MISVIAIHEFVRCVKSLRFSVCLILSTVLGILVSYATVADFEREMAEHSEIVAVTSRMVRNTRVWMELQPTVYKRPEALSFFAQGVSRKLARGVTVRLDRVPEMQSTGQGGNPFLSVFPRLDVLLVIKVALGLLALLLGFDAVAGEREVGTLALLLSNPVPRLALLLGKVAGAVSSLLLAAVLGGVISLLVFLQSPSVSLSGEDWLRCATVFVAASLYLLALYLLALTISTLTRHSSTALGVTLLVWALLLVVVPNLALHVATQLHRPPSEREIDSRVKALREELSRDLDRLRPSPVEGTVTQKDECQ